MVDLECIKLLVRPIDVEKETAEGDEDVTRYVSVLTLSVLRLLSIHVVTMAFLKPVYLAMAHVVVLVGKCLLTHPNFSPALGIVFASVEVERQGQSQLYPLCLGEREELCIYIEHEEGRVVFAMGADSRDSVILLTVDGLDDKGVFEKKSL